MSVARIAKQENQMNFGERKKKCHEPTSGRCSKKCKKITCYNPKGVLRSRTETLLLPRCPSKENSPVFDNLPGFGGWEGTA